ncbi:hypothetical protein Esti_005365 [Eimeria stiedai]
MAVKASKARRHKGGPRGPWRPLGAPKGDQSVQQGASLQQQRQQQKSSNTSSSAEEESAAESWAAEEAAAAATAAGSSTEGSAVSSADSSEELRCSTDSDFESEDAGEYEVTEGPPSLGGAPPRRGPPKGRPPEADGVQQALGEEPQQKHPDFLDFVLSAAAGSDEEETLSDGEGDDLDSLSEEEEQQRPSGEQQQQRPSGEQQQQQQRRMLTQGRFLGLCKAIGINPLLVKKETAEGDQQQQIKSHRGAQLLLEALRSAVLQLAPKQQQTIAAGAADAAAAASAGERSKFKQARKLQGDADASQEQQQQLRNKLALKRQQQQQRSSSKSTFALPDDETCVFVILSVVRAGDSIFSGLSSKKGQSAAAAAAATPAEATAAAAAAATPAAATAAAAAAAAAGSAKLRRLLRGFWGDVTHLLLAARQQQAAAAGLGDLLLQLLLALSNKQLLRWVLSQEAATRRLLQAICRYWAYSHKQQLAAFAVLRSVLLLHQAAAAPAAAAAQGKQKKRKGGKAAAAAAAADISAEAREQRLLQQLLRAYQGAAARLGLRRTWRAASRMQLLANELSELLSLAAPPTLALTVRTALAAGSTATAGSNSNSSSSSKKDVSKSKAAHRRRHRLQQAQSLLLCWPFVCCCGLWASALVIHQGSLKPLLFPLVSVAAAAVKLQQQQLACAPFCLNLLDAVARAGIATDTLVPVAAPLLLLLQLLLQQHAAVCKRSSSNVGPAAAPPHTKKKKQKKTAAAATAAAGPLRLQQAAAAHVETCLKLDAAQQESLHVLESLLDFGACLLARHLAQLAAHPALPEVLLPLLSSLKQLTKKVQHFGAAKKLRQLAAAAAASAEVVKRLRLSLKDLPIGRVAVLPIHQEKQQMPLLAFSEALIKERQKAMADGVREETAAAERRKRKEVEEGLTAKQIKRRRQREERRAAREEERQQQQKRLKKAEKREAAAALTSATEDALEEFDSDLSDLKIYKQPPIAAAAAAAVQRLHSAAQQLTLAGSGSGESGCWGCSKRGSNSCDRSS